MRLILVDDPSHITLGHRAIPYSRWLDIPATLGQYMVRLQSESDGALYPDFHFATRKVFPHVKNVFLTRGILDLKSKDLKACEHVEQGLVILSMGSAKEGELVEFITIPDGSQILAVYFRHQSPEKLVPERLPCPVSLGGTVSKDPAHY